MIVELIIRSCIGTEIKIQEGAADVIYRLPKRIMRYFPSRQQNPKSKKTKNEVRIILTYETTIIIHG